MFGDDTVLSSVADVSFLCMTSFGLVDSDVDDVFWILSFIASRFFSDSVLLLAIIFSLFSLL